jgi:integrase
MASTCPQRPKYPGPVCRTDPADVTSLASLFTPLTRAYTILQFLYFRAGCQPSAAGMHVAQALRIVAKYYLELPENQVAWITQWGKDVTLSYQGMTEKNEKSIAAVMVPACERRLIELPDAFMAAARQRLAADPHEAAGLALRTLAIEILTTYPFRLANLLGLRFDRHLHRADPRGLVSGILISPPEVKNSQQIVLPISARLGRFIEAWTTRFRGVIASPGCGYLFPGYGTGDRPMTPQGLREAIKGAMGDYVGAVLTPHQFRHLAADRFLLGLSGALRSVAPAAGP